MNKLPKIIVSAGIAVIITGIALLAFYLWWSRPNRLPEAEIRSLLTKSWEKMYATNPQGKRIVTYDIGGRRFRTNVKVPLESPGQLIANRLNEVFPHAEPYPEFFDNFTLSHRGRVFVAGRWCEKLRVAPTGYSGNSVEVWVDPDSGFPMGVRRLDSGGGFIHGWRYLGRFNLPSANGETDIDMQPGQGLFELFRGMHEEIPEIRLRELGADPPFGFPETLPGGFTLSSGRRIMQLVQMDSFRDFFPGLDAPNRGHGQPDNQAPPDQIGIMNFVYSDGLNNISLIHFPLGRAVSLTGSPDMLKLALLQKSEEVNRLFHTSMSFKITPGMLFILYGDISQDELDMVMGSISLPPVDQGFFPGHPDQAPPQGPNDQERPFGRGPFGPRGPGNRNNGPPPENFPGGNN